MWNGKPPNLNNLKIFGSRAFVHEKGFLKKLDHRSKEYTFIGYTRMGYRLWDEEKRKIVVSRDVKFTGETPNSTKKRIHSIFSQVNEDGNSEEDEEEELRSENTVEQNARNNLEDAPETTDDEENELEPQQRRSTRQTKVPEKFNDYVMTPDSDEILNESALLTYAEATSGIDREKWLAAIEE